MVSQQLKKWASMFALVGIFMFSGVVLFQLQVAFGWTNPLGNPPGPSGAVGVSTGQVFIGPGGTTASGTAILTVNGGVTVMNNLISDVNTPVAGKDAANKNYVQAQAGGGGMLTIYGMAGSVIPWANFNVAMATRTFMNCLIGTGVTCNWAIAGLPGPGGALTCPVNAPTLVFSGYGPYAYIQRNYFYAPIPAPGSYAGGPPRSEDDGNKPDPGTNVPMVHLPRYFGVTYSVCGSQPALVAQTDYAILDNGMPGPSNVTGLGEAAGILSACSPNGPGSYACNVCIVCK